MLTGRSDQGSGVEWPCKHNTNLPSHLCLSMPVLSPRMMTFFCHASLATCISRSQSCSAMSNRMSLWLQSLGMRGGGERGKGSR